VAFGKFLDSALSALIFKKLIIAGGTVYFGLAVSDNQELKG